MSEPDAVGTVICIEGPTASGKSDLAQSVACALETSVISADAMQVYRGMDVGTAKTPMAERRCPLEMVDVVDVSEEFSVARFQGMARACVDTLLSRDKTPVIAGGTGLYVDAVIDEMDFPAGSVMSESRSAYERRLAEEGPHALHEELARRDPASAELIHENNVRRVIRALELSDEGTSYAQHHAGIHEHVPHYAARIWGLTMSREHLYARIDRRVDEMMEKGLVDEVRSLLDQGLASSTTARQAIGYKEIISYLNGDLNLRDATELVKRDSRRYAKRQLSWLKRDGRVTWLDMDTIDPSSAQQKVLEDLERSQGTEQDDAR